jgi:hypothetical protein
MSVGRRQADGKTLCRHTPTAADMAEIRIGVRVSLRGRALRVVGLSAPSAEPRRLFLDDEETGERFVVTTRVLGIRRLAGDKSP